MSDQPIGHELTWNMDEWKAAAMNQMETKLPTLPKGQEFRGLETLAEFRTRIEMLMPDLPPEQMDAMAEAALQRKKDIRARKARVLKNKSERDERDSRVDVVGFRQHVLDLAKKNGVDVAAIESASFAAFVDALTLEYAESNNRSQQNQQNPQSQQKRRVEITVKETYKDASLDDLKKARSLIEGRIDTITFEEFSVLEFETRHMQREAQKVHERFRAMVLELKKTGKLDAKVEDLKKQGRRDVVASIERALSELAEIPNHPDAANSTALPEATGN